MVTNRYRDAFTEVCTILDNLIEEDYKKIPSDVIETISKNMNAEYKYEIDENGDLSNQTMLPETKAILFNLFRDYLSTPEQKEKIIRIQKEERQKNEEEKNERYSLNVFENRNNKIENERLDSNEEKSLSVIKENIITKILNKIRNLFKIRR